MSIFEKMRYLKSRLKTQKNITIGVVIAYLMLGFAAFGATADYVSINSDANGNRQSEGATATNAIAIGPSATATGESSLAVGDTANASKYASAFGSLSKATGEGALALGNTSNASGQNATSIGVQANSSGIQSNAIGALSNASGQNATAIGVQSKSEGVQSNAIGTLSNAAGINDIAIGTQSNAIGKNSIAIGYQSNSKSSSAVSIGNKAVSHATYSTTLGSTANTHGGYATAVGSYASGLSDGTTSFGSRSRAAGYRATALGSYADSKGHESIAIGDAARSEKADSIAIGRGSKSEVISGVALGAESVAKVDSGMFGFDLDKGGVLTSVSDISTLTDAEKARALELEANVNNLKTEFETKDQEYMNRLFTLHGELVKARNANDTAKVSELLAERALLERAVTSARMNYYSNAEVKEYNKLVGTWKSTLSAVSIGDKEEGLTRQINNLAAGTEDTDAVNVAQLKSINLKVTGDNLANDATAIGKVRLHDQKLAINGTSGEITTTVAKDGQTVIISLADEIKNKVNAMKYFSVKSTLAGNSQNNGASGENSIAIGPNANSTVKDGVALGNGASVNNAQGTPGTSGIAIGTGAQSHQMSSAMHEVLVRFKRTKDKMTGGIAIGTQTHARISTIDIGNRDYVGRIGDIEFNKNGVDSWNSISGVGTTTVGDNSINTSNFSTINGSFNTITNSQRNGNQFHNLAKAMQGFGASIIGSLNSIEGNEDLVGSGTGRLDQILVALGAKHPATGLMYSGTASNAIGFANKISKSNGALIYGAGNEITNSYLTPSGANEITKLVGASFLDPNNTGVEIKELADSFRKYMGNARLGSVGVIGGANKVDYALFSTVNGVGNELKGKGNITLSETNTTMSQVTKNGSAFAIFNQITGYENKATNVSNLMLTGSKNVVEHASNNIVTGNNHSIKGTETEIAEGNVVIGFNKNKSDSNFKASAKNIVAIGNDIVATQDDSVYLGNGSKDAAAANTKAMDTYSTDTINGITLNFAGGTPTGLVSVGSEGKERRIQNVASGWISATSTDAINGSQLYSVIDKFNSKLSESPKINVVGSGNVTVNPEEKDGTKTFTVGISEGSITSAKGGNASINKDGVVTATTVINAINALGNNTISFSGNTGNTDSQNLNKENGITFGIKGK
ncbi:hypothetical protein HP397_05905, partial [Streptobacillus felis]|nr:hypothetical protein [Streptobacillus felis]